MKTFEEIEKLNSMCNDILNGDTFFIVVTKEKTLSVSAMVYGEGWEVSRMIIELMNRDEQVRDMLIATIFVSLKKNGIDIVELAKRFAVK